ncbi:Choline-sulfatase [Polystyrenella longa]|uniref:Choline-sulfatase n=1 Tax=Polystyrenella longa TaxID=2528007 RepID=A0A518CU70_9PLAN|nr:sulfatase [Polystyrenella longa]QDU82776.1 Choline-sulfatase [Polystyrenella longa]
MNRLLYVTLFSFFLLGMSTSCGFLHADDRPNVLFIAVDDLRPELACYGKTHIHSPNIDRLAETGVLFERAYCMVPTCGASRASLMTGIRPAPHRFVNYLAWAEKDAPDAKTMNTQFKENGYHTVSLGKIFHHPEDNEQGWSEPAWRVKNVSWWQDPASQKIHNQRQKMGKGIRGPAFESPEVPDNAYSDGLLAEQAISDLQRLSKQKEPFFLSVGFLKPHLPFNAPKKYWDLYNHAEIQLPDNYHVPKDAPSESIHRSGELRAYSNIPANGPVSTETARKLIHGYYACVSYTDALIGQVLEELDRLELAENTIVVLWGDHGWNLGEHTLWCKHSCYETSLLIPIIIRAPGIDGGQRRRQLIESIDLYPTLCDLTRISKPIHLQGDSLVPLLLNEQSEWKKSAISRYRKGDTIRTEGYRYTEFRDHQGIQSGRMLYDHGADPGENVNVAKESPEAVSELAAELNKRKGQDDGH